MELQVKQHEEEQQRSFEEQSVLALEDRKSSLLRVMTSSSAGKAFREIIAKTVTDLTVVLVLYMVLVLVLSLKLEP